MGSTAASFFLAFFMIAIGLKRIGNADLTVVRSMVKNTRGTKMPVMAPMRQSWKAYSKLADLSVYMQSNIKRTTPSAMRMQNGVQVAYM